MDKRPAPGDAPRPAPTGQVASPCISVCRIDPVSGLCEGCQRTIDEIARWGSMGGDARLQVWRLIAERRAGTGPTPATR